MFKILRKLLIALCITLMVIGTSCETNEIKYGFPLKIEDFEEVIFNKKSDWNIEDTEEAEDYATITLKNSEEVILHIRSTMHDTGHRLNIIWHLPHEFNNDQIHEFYQNKLMEIFNLLSTFYVNSGRLINGFNEFINYYEKNREGLEVGAYWEKRIGDEHIVLDMKSYQSEDNRNRLGTLFISNNSSYEQYLHLLNESWEKTAIIYSIEITEITVDDLKKYINLSYEGNNLGEHFVIKGYLEDIKEIKDIPDSLKNIVSSQFLKSNRDKYLTATLKDDTGSIDVFLQITSLNDEELSKERNHNVVLFYHEETPVIIDRFSSLLK